MRNSSDFQRTTAFPGQAEECDPLHRHVADPMKTMRDVPYSEAVAGRVWSVLALNLNRVRP